MSVASGRGSDLVFLTLADGTHERIEVPAGQGQARADQMLGLTGDYAAGWISAPDKPHRRINLRALVALDVYGPDDERPLETYE